MPFVGLNVSLRGSEKMLLIYESVGSVTFTRAVARGVYAEANRIMRMAKGQVPLEDGPLRASGTVEEPIVSGTAWEITLGFGGAASAYALIQHENLTFNHAPGRKAKYLEDPVRAALPTIEARLNRSVSNYFRGNVGFS